MGVTCRVVLVVLYEDRYGAEQVLLGQVELLWGACRLLNVIMSNRAVPGKHHVQDSVRASVQTPPDTALVLNTADPEPSLNSWTLEDHWSEGDVVR